MDEEQQDISKVPLHLQPHVFKKGQSGNPKGRPEGTISLKQYAKKMLEEMDDDQRQEFLQGLPKQFIWEMGEGKAESKTDITSDGKALTVQVINYNANDTDTPQLPQTD